MSVKDQKLSLQIARLDYPGHPLHDVPMVRIIKEINGRKAVSVFPFEEDMSLDVFFEGIDCAFDMAANRDE